MSKLFSGAQIKRWDEYTILHEPISSIQLMERAAKACFQWIIKKWPDKKTGFTICCGNGNNGGDGLAIARLLLEDAYQVEVFILASSHRSHDNAANLAALEQLFQPCIHVFNQSSTIDKNHIVIDAIFGTGLNKPVTGSEKELITIINNCLNQKVSIDIPSGLYTDEIGYESVVLQTDYTLSFQNYKRSFLFSETGKYCGQVIVLDIQLSKSFMDDEPSSDFVLTLEELQSYYQKRSPFSHKGTHGHALLIAGSHGMMGAAILASRACIRSGVGLTSVLIPGSENDILQSSVPEVISQTYPRNPHLEVSLWNKYNAIGIGCGFGTDAISVKILEEILNNSNRPLVIDADAINIISSRKDSLSKIPFNSVLTPHPKEFDRLFGASINSMERNKFQIEMSKQYQIYIVLKGHFTSISTPEGECFFNTTGNAGMAKGGSGDVLTGMITALYAQYKNMKTACLMGVYLHGCAGDLAAIKYTEESMTASDIIDHINDAIKECFY